MKLLNAKNKKYAMMAFAVIGALFIINIVVEAGKAGAKTAGDYGNALWGAIKGLFSFSNVIAILGLVCFFFGFHDGGVTMAVALGTLTTGAAVVSSFNTTYVPKRFHYVAATQLTGVKITVQGEGVIFDSDANGLTHCGVTRLLGQVTNGYTFTISNGFIPGKNVLWEFTNSAAQTPVIYVESDETFKGNQRMYLQLLRQTILANSGQDFDDFATLSLPSIAATDQVNIFYNDGTQQQLNRADILERLQFTQNVVNTPIYQIDNYDLRIKKVNIIASAQQTAYVQRWQAVSGGMLSQVVNR
jgi:hypothetical protein